jgi:hypothetical protein
MLNIFACTQNPFPTSSLYYGLYDCTTILDGIVDGMVNPYYFRCEDQPTQPQNVRNVNAESYVYKLQGTHGLDITSVDPDNGVELFTNSPVLKVVTSGGAFGDGTSLCGYNFVDPSVMSSVDFLNTNSSVHTQPFFNLTEGDYDVYVNCVDLAGNLANETAEFKISVDTQPPRLLQAYTDPGMLNIIMDEPSTCEYSVDGSFVYGTNVGIQMTGANTEEHTASLEGDTFWISCSDVFGVVGSFVIYV